MNTAQWNQVKFTSDLRLVHSHNRIAHGHTSSSMLRLAPIHIIYCWLIAVCAWSPVAAFLAATSDYFTYSSPFKPPWILGPPVNRAKFPDEEFQHDSTKVRRLTSMMYKGQSYVMVDNLTLSFDQAETYCQTEFSEPMHLASVHSNEEWENFIDAFSQYYPSGLWLGGIIEHPKPNVFILLWLDNTPADYHRFSPIERERWVSSWQIDGHGCIVVNAEQRSNWSVDVAPCEDSRAFVCKRPRNTDSDLPIHIQMKQSHFGPRHRQLNIFREFFRPFLLPPRLRIPHIGSFELHPSNRQTSHFHIVDNYRSPYDHETSRAQSDHLTTTEPTSAGMMTEPQDVTEETPRTPLTFAIRSMAVTTTKTPDTRSTTPDSSTEDLSIEPKPPTPVGNETVRVTNSTLPAGAVPQQSDTIQSQSTRIIRTAALPTELRNSAMPSTGNPNFIIVPATPRSSSSISMVRMPILKSNAQVIYPLSIWDLA